MAVSAPGVPDVDHVAPLRTAGRAAGGSAAVRWLAGAPWPVVAVLLVGFAAFHLTSFPGRLDDDPVFNSPHENVRYELAERWLETGSPTAPLPLLDELPPDIGPALTPRDAGLLDGEVVPKDFPYAIGLVTGLRAVTPWLPALVTTVSAVLLLVVTTALGRTVLGSRGAGLVAALLLGSTIPFWSAGSGLVETGATTASLAVAGTLALVRRRTSSLAGGEAGGSGGVGLDALAGVCFGLATGMHHATVLLAAGTALAFARHRDGGSMRRLVVLVAAAAAALVPVLVFNAAVYGSPLTDGYSVGVDFLDENLGENTGGLLALRPGPLLDHVVRYLLRPEALAVLVLAAVGLVAARRRPAPGAEVASGAGAVPVLGLALLLGGIPLLVFSGARPLSGVDSFLVNASLMRYLAPLAALAAVCAAGGVLAVGRRRPLVAAVVCGLTVVSGMTVAVTGPQGPLDVSERIPRDRVARERALAIVPADAVLVTGRSDKLLWPRRATLSAPYLVDEPPPPGDDTHLARRVPTPLRLAEVVVGVTDAGFQVFVWNEGRWFDGDRRFAVAELDVALAEEGIVRRTTDIRGLWRFEAAAPDPSGQ